MRKKRSLTLSVPQRLEGLLAVVLVIAMLYWLAESAHSLYLFPVPDSFRWYGDETWMLLAWKNLLTHGRLILPFARGSTLESSPGLLLGSPWLAALVYGAPQMLAPVDTDVITIGRTVSFILGLSIIFVIGWGAYRLGISGRAAILSMGVLVTASSFTFASHSSRYDMMTGLALLTFVVACATARVSKKGVRRRRPSTVFWIGFAGVLTAFTISPHLEALLAPVLLFIAWRAAAFRGPKCIAAFISGIVLALFLLVLVYSIANHSFSLAGGITSDNQFGSVLNNLPVRHLFSWSAQRHQLWAKGYYLWAEAPLFAIAIALILISEVILLVTKRPHPRTAYLTACLFLATVSGLFLQSTLPYYLVHLLPLAAFVFAAHLNEWRHTTWLHPAVAFASLGVAIAIAIWWVPELLNAGRIGKRIDEANSAAVQAAFEAQRPEAGSMKPLVLAQAPALHELLRDSSVRAMSEAFLFFPLRREPPDSTVRRLGVRFIVDYNHPMTAAYERMVRSATPVFSRAGALLDRTVDYFHDTTGEWDTLTLYRIDSVHE